MAYSVFALYASGKDAVIGGMLVLGITYVIWGFIAPRFTAAATRGRRRREDRRDRGTRNASQGEQPCKLNEFAIPRGLPVRLASRAHRRCSPSSASRSPRCPRRRRRSSASATTGRIRLGYLADARPFSYRDECGRRRRLRRRAVPADRRAREDATRSARTSPSTGCRSRSTTRLREVQQGSVDLLCTPTSVTLARRAGRLVLDSDLRRAAIARSCARMRRRPARRARRAPASTTGLARLAGREGAREDTPSPSSPARPRRPGSRERRATLPDRRRRSCRSRTIGPALQQLLDRKVDVFFGDRALVLGAMDDAARENLVVLDRAVHARAARARARARRRRLSPARRRALSELYASGDFPRAVQEVVRRRSTRTRARSSSGTRRRHSEAASALKQLGS